jgi:O-ureido-D-serine cyclo-ligase
MKIALATCLNPPQEDFDAPPLLDALAARGHQAHQAAWDDTTQRWDDYDAVLLRSTWNYFHDLPRFLAWAEHVASQSRLWNSLEVVRWNTHKFYLRDLESRGIPIVPTEFVPAGSHFDLQTCFAVRGWSSAVIKPAVSADAFATVRADRAAPAAGLLHLQTHLPVRDMLVQSYMTTVAEPGERCLVFLDGEYSHTVRKRSLFLGGRHAGPEGVPVSAGDDEIMLARRVLSQIELTTPLYARIDLLRDPEGIPRLMELELVEPSLFLEEAPGSAERLAAGLEARLAL